MKKPTEYDKLKQRFLEMYGYICSCCGEFNPKFLTLDHVQNDGNEKRYTVEFMVRLDPEHPVPILKRKPTAYFLKDALKEYKPDYYQILCYNCNIARAHNYGICPHKQECRDNKAWRKGRMSVSIQNGTKGDGQT